MRDIAEWPDANQRFLFVAMGEVAAHLGDDASELAGAETALRGAAESLSAPSALDALAQAFGLTTFERAVVLLAAAIELLPGIPERCAHAARDPSRPFVTFALALSRLPGAHWSALAPSRPLRLFRLVELDLNEGALHGRLRLAERVMQQLCGVSSLDARLSSLLVPLARVADDALAPSHAEAVARVIALWGRPPGSAGWPIAQLSGRDASAKEAVVAAACDALGLGVYALDASDVPSTASERDLLARLWEREAVLGSSVLYLHVDECDGAEPARAAVALSERVDTLVALAARDPLRLRRRSSVRIDVPRATPVEQEELWRRALARSGRALNGDTGALTAQFNLGIAGLRDASAEVIARVAEGDDAPLETLAWQACRAQSRVRLDDLAQRIDARVTWSDLVLPREQLELLHDLSAQVRQRALVYETWGFGRSSDRGLGISALFAGVSGTGKTLAAEVIAAELDLDLYRVDLSQVVSKYLGETEKNLRRIFEAAEEAGAVLLFDEADALFGKRSEVKDSHDRYANIEVSYLLQRMEQYRGLAILTSNMRNALDQAFVRRLRFVVEFPFPDVEQRAQIWRRVFPSGMPLGALEWQQVARLNITGGTIRNIAVQAAFIAADARQPLDMRHLGRAARAEYRKLEKPLNELGGWA
jgi:hypothetical protein